MRLPPAVHVLAGSLALVFGFVALFAAKGAAADIAAPTRTLVSRG